MSRTIIKKYSGLDFYKKLGRIKVPTSQENKVSSHLPEWVYYVRVCDHPFYFSSIEQIQEFADYYSQENVPVQNRQNPTTAFDVLPPHLREEANHWQVVEALTKAIQQFQP